MNLNVPVLDLSTVIAMLASMGGVTGLLAVLRLLFLDRALSGLDATQQNLILRAVLIALNFLAIVGLALVMGAAFDRSLIVSAALATVGASSGAHIVFTSVKATVYSSGLAAGAKTEAPIAATGSVADWPATDTPAAQ